MYRTIPYLILFAVTVLLQVFLFDNLSISVYLNPLIYIAFILLLPLDTPHIVLLLLGLATGVGMDWFMGAAGLNTLAILPVAFARPGVVSLLCKRDDMREGGIPSDERFGKWTFLNYLVVLVLLHHTLFFVFESLSWARMGYTLLRIVVSSAVSVGFVWIIASVFNSKFPTRI